SRERFEYYPRRERRRPRPIPARWIGSAGRRTYPGPVCEMILGELMAGVVTQDPISAQLAALEIKGLDFDSRRVGKDYLFFAFAGARVDGRQFAEDAIARGAAAVVSEQEAPPPLQSRWIRVEHGRRA